MSRVPFPGAVILEGVRLPFVHNTVRPVGVGPGVMTGGFTLGPIPSPAEAGVPSGFLVPPTADAVGFLTQANVNTIVQRAIAQAQRTRAAIRLPLGSATRMVIAVAGLDGTHDRLRRDAALSPRHRRHPARPVLR